MLPKINRLEKKQDFIRVLRSRIVCFTPCCSVKVYKNSVQKNRCAVVVGKKIEKKAVRRNKIKRILREALRDVAKTHKTGYDIIVIARSKNYVYKKHEVAEQLTNILKNK